MPLFDTTPVIPSRLRGDRPVIRYKMDCFQPTGSFKIRGMDNFVRQARIVDNQTRFVASSGGNAGISLAYAGQQHGAEVTVVVPESTPLRARSIIEGLGATVKVHGAQWNAADELARAMASEQGAAYVSPFDHPWLWEGHSSLVDELVAHCAASGEEFPATIVVSVGGGGLMLGVLKGLERHGKLETTQVVAAETVGAASMKASLQAGSLQTLDRIDSVATSLGARQVSRVAFDQGLKAKVKSYVMTDDEAVAACRQFLYEFNVVVEPACGAALAYGYREGFDEENVLIVACGGIAWSIEELMGYSNRA